MAIPNATVTFPQLQAGASAPTQLPIGIRVIGAEYSHEVAVISYRYDERFKSICTRGVPVRIVYGRSPNLALFVGVIHHVTLDQPASSTNVPRTMDVVCVGATDPLNAPGEVQYRDTRVDVAASDMANRFGLSSLTSTHPFSWPLLQQAQTPSWAFLVECAKRVGWTVYARATDIRFHSRAIRYSGSPVFRYRGGVTPDNAEQSVFSFNVVHGETLAADASKRDRVVQGYDDMGTLYTASTGQIGQLAGPRVVAAQQTTYSKLAARSVAEAEAMLAGEQELNRHYIQGTAVVSGDARVHPGRSARLVGIDTDYSGYWYVRRADHIFSETLYQTSLTLGRDSLGDSGGARIISADKPRVVVHDGYTVGPSPASLQATAPASVWSSVYNQWRAVAPITRNLPLPMRRPVVTR